MGGWIFGNGLVGLFSCFDGGAGAMAFGIGLTLQKGIRKKASFNCTAKAPSIV